MAPFSSYLEIRTRVRLVFSVLLAWSGLSLWACEEDDGGFAGCQTDNDCKNDRVCIQGMCQSPGGQTSGDETTSAEPTTGASNGEGTGSESASDTTDTTDTTDASATNASTSGPSGSDSGSTGSGPELQPYGKCVFECTTDADCCDEHSCDGDTQYVCEQGLCRGECMPSCESSTLGNFSWTCVTDQIAPSDSTFCGLPCEGNTCSSVGGDYTCVPDGAYEPDVCGVDCSQTGVACSGSNGAACLPNGDCGCYDDGDCSPGYTCFRAWE